MTERMGILEVVGPVSTLRGLEARLSEDPTAPKLRLRMVPTIPADELVYIKDLTPAQAKRLKTMTTAELKALAKRQAMARGEAVRP